MFLFQEELFHHVYIRRMKSPIIHFVDLRLQIVARPVSYTHLLKGTTMARSKENFSGSSSLDGKNGMFAMKLTERDYENFTPVSYTHL